MKPIIALFFFIVVISNDVFTQTVTFTYDNGDARSGMRDTGCGVGIWQKVVLETILY